MRPSQLLAAIVALSSVTAATSNVFDSINALGEAKHMFLPRADDESSSAKEAKTTEAPKETDKASNSDKASETEKPTATKGDSKATDKDDKDSKSGKATKTSGKPKVTNFGPDVQAGGISMVTPNAMLGQQYYKIGDWITFGWNYTSVSIMPSAVDIMASCSVNQQTYTIAVNHSAKATDSVIWDTKNYKKNHPNSPDFVSEMYTLLIYDAESSVSATPKPGYLSPYNQFRFGLYTPQPYVKWEDFECANCLKNDALSLLASPTSRVLFVTLGTTAASFLYFANAFGIL